MGMKIEHDITVTVQGRLGCGKTTTIRTMQKALRKAGYSVTESQATGMRQEEFYIDVNKGPFPHKLEEDD